MVSASVSQRVTVEGSVREPGIYEIQGQTTLLQALAIGTLACGRANGSLALITWRPKFT